MTEQKLQKVADLIDDVSIDAVDELIQDQEMQSIWSRFHLVRDILKGDVTESIALDFDKSVSAAVSKEPTVLVTTINNPQHSLKPANKPSFIGSVFGTKARDWAEQATGLAIAASVTAVIVFGVQNMNNPATTLQSSDITHSAITSLELIEADNLEIGKQPTYTRHQQSLLDYTRTSSQYGLRTLTPLVSVVNHSVTVPLTLIKSKFDSILETSEPLVTVTPSRTEQEQNKSQQSDTNQ